MNVNRCASRELNAIADRTQEEAVFERATESLERRHTSATAAARIDAMLERAAHFTEYTPKEMLEKLAAHMPPHDRARFGRVFLRYIELVENAKDQEDELRQAFTALQAEIPHGMNERVERQFAEDIEDQFSEEGSKRVRLPGKRPADPTERQKVARSFEAFVFYLRTGRAPKGEVTFKREGPYFTLVCTQKGDYAEASRGSESPNVYDYVSGGTFHRAMSMEFTLSSRSEKVHLTLPVLLLKLTKHMKPFYQDIASHERRHSINHLLFSQPEGPHQPFDDMEPGTGEPSDEQLVGQNLKDEILAYLDGNTEDLVDALSDELYQHLFPRFLPGKTRKQLMDKVQEIETAVRQHILWKEAPHRVRRILLYHLTDIDFFRIPKALSLIDRFYQRRVQQLAAQRVPAHILVMFYAKAHEGQAMHMRKLVKELEEICDHAKAIAIEADEAGVYKRAVERTQILSQQARTLCDQLHVRSTWGGRV